MDEEGEKSYADQSTQYTLKGIVVHSGQASGGHYYSYIKHTHKEEDRTVYVHVMCIISLLACFTVCTRC